MSFGVIRRDPCDTYSCFPLSCQHSSTAGVPIHTVLNCSVELTVWGWGTSCLDFPTWQPKLAGLGSLEKDWGKSGKIGGGDMDTFYWSKLFYFFSFLFLNNCRLIGLSKIVQRGLQCPCGYILCNYGIIPKPGTDTGPMCAYSSVPLGHLCRFMWAPPQPGRRHLRDRVLPLQSHLLLSSIPSVTLPHWFVLHLYTFVILRML